TPAFRRGACRGFINTAALLAACLLKRLVSFTRRSVLLTADSAGAGGADFDARAFQRSPNASREGQRVRAVAMQADGLRVDRHPFAADRPHPLLLRHAERAFEHGFFVVEK